MEKKVSTKYKVVKWGNHYFLQNRYYVVREHETLMHEGTKKECKKMTDELNDR